MTPQAIVGGVYNLLAAVLAILGGVGIRRLEFYDPLPVSIPGAMFVAGVLYALAGVCLLVPRRETFLLGRAFLILGIAANLFLLVSGANWIPLELISAYPFLIPVPGLLVGLSMLESIVLFWPEEKK